MEEKIRRTGIDIIGDVPWGTHFCQFYQTKEDLIGILVPYFKAGLESNEFCMWVTSEPLKVEDAKRSLKEVVKDLDNYVEKGQIEILDASQWYTRSGKFDADKVLQGWVEKESQAVKRGFDGLRLTGNTFWLEERDWTDFANYEAVVNSVIGDYRMLAICSYSLGKCGASEVIDVVSNHQLVLIRRGGEWELIESSEHKRAEDTLQASTRRWQTTFDAINDAVYLLDTEGKILQCNKATSDLLGKPSTEIVGGTCWELMHGTSEPIEGCPIVRMKETYRRESLVLPIGDRWFNVSADPLLDEAGNLTGAVHIISDITERKQVENELKETNAFLRNILESSSSISIVSTDLDRNILYWNVGAENIFGYKAEEVVGSCKIDILYGDEEETRKKIEEIGSTVLSSQEGANCEIKEIAKDGRKLWINLALTPRLDENGQLIGILGIGEDITERKRVENLVHTQRDLGLSLSAAVGLDEGLRLCVEAAIQVSEMDCGAVYLADKTSGELDLVFHKGLSPAFVRSASHYDAVSDNARLVMAGKPVYARCQELDALLDEVALRERLRAIAVVPILHEDRVIACLNIASHTLDEVPPFARSALEVIAAQIGSAVARLEAEEELRASEEKYRHIAENPIVGVGMAQDGTVIYINDAYCRMFGYEKDELVGESELKVVAPEDHPLIEQRTRKRLKGEKVPNHYVFRGVKKDGTGLFIEVSSSEPFVYKNKPTLLAVFRDITEKRKMEEELLKADKLESVGILAGGIAHDFNNILTAILGNISLARLFPDAGKISERLVEAEKACMQAKDLTQQLLTFARGGAPVKKTASIGEILKDSASFALRGSNVRCEFSIPDGLWPADVDAGQISQVISNILINADHAMPEGGVVTVRAENVTVGAEEALPLEDGEYVKITMEDQGIGIPEEHLQRIFDPYFTTKQKGSGLGLATSYSIIKNHDGHITAESQVGVGTIFYIYLPASPGKALVEEEKEEERPIMGEGRILVMDDEKHVRDAVAEMLVSIGYNVTTSIDGHEAIEMYREAKEFGQPYDAIIMDIVVPGGMGGKETIRKLIEVDPEVNVIVSSGYSNDPIMAGFREYGFNGAIAKPYKIREMSEVLHRVINGF